MLFAFIMQRRIVKPVTFLGIWLDLAILYKLSSKKIIENMGQAIGVKCFSKDVVIEFRWIDEIFIGLLIDIQRIDSLNIQIVIVQPDS